jgi:hypothetical protein
MGIPIKKVVKKERKRAANMFMDFAKHHQTMIDRLVKENENRIALEALSRRKV